MSSPIIDSKCTSLREAIRDPKIPIPWKVRRTLVLVTVLYYSFDGKVHQGQLVVHRDLKEDVKQIFARLLTIRFPINKVVPIVEYDWDDNASMADNNSSAFNYRPIARAIPPRWSEHAFGWAIDLNTVQNPFIDEQGTVSPSGAVYDVSVPGTIAPDGELVKIFLERGWAWGGHWKSIKDYQHFQKPLNR